MTITYSLDVSSSTFLSFTKLLLRWRGSVWKMVWKELLVWLVMFFTLSLIYRLALSSDQKITFEDVVSFCYKYADQIPLTFMLGFYVSLVINRWWNMFNNIGWVDNAAMHLAAYCPGTDERSRMLRRNCVRYLVLTQAMVFRNISTAVRKRFPTEDTLVTAGLMSAKEKEVFDSVVSPHKKTFMPVHWSMALLRQARMEGRIASDFFLQDLYLKLNQFRANVGILSNYDWVPIPLVYTQVVFLTVRCYFLITLMGRQYIRPAADRQSQLSFSSPIDLYFPILTIIQFVFYVGWMKVAEALLNPFGEDDDDFEVNYIIDRNLQVGFTIVDDAVGKVPTQARDVFWEETIPEPLYSEQTHQRPANPQVGSASQLDLPSAVLMVPRQISNMTGSVSMLYSEAPSHKASYIGTISRTSSGRTSRRSSRRFSEMLKSRFGRMMSHTSRAGRPSLAENGDLPGAAANSLSPTATTPRIHHPSENSLSSVMQDLAEISEQTDEQLDEVFTHDILEVVPEIEETEEITATTSTNSDTKSNTDNR